MDTFLIENDEKYLNKFGGTEDFKSLGWGTEESQQKRFKILKEIPGYSELDSVLDVGCGHGDFCKILGENYKGIDIRNSVIEISKKKYPNRTFDCQSIEEVNEKYDWIFASGIFGFNRLDWENNVEKTLTKMTEKCIKGVSVNFLSDLSTGKKDPEMYYCQPAKAIDLIKKITNKFCLRHDYRPNDFTVYILK